MTIEEIIKRKEELISIKKLAIKYTDQVKTLPIKEDVDGVLKVDMIQDEPNENIKVIANTYNWLDSHGDVHVKGCFTKSIAESLPANKIFHFDNHEHSFKSKVGNVKNVTETKVKWSDLGINKDGQTIALIGETELIEDYNCQVYNAYKAGEIDQHSVGMQYLNIALAVNNPANEDEFKVWNEIFPLLGNPESALSEGHFWVVREAKLKEYSCVLWRGSNSLTPTIKNIEPLEDTQDPEPITITQNAQKEFIINLLKQNK